MMQAMEEKAKREALETKMKSITEQAERYVDAEVRYNTKHTEMMEVKRKYDKLALAFCQAMRFVHRITDVQQKFTIFSLVSPIRIDDPRIDKLMEWFEEGLRT